jgi:RND family efflux transporter MFP subunit
LEELQNGSRPEEIMQAKANLLGAKALVDFASAKYRRWQSLYEQGRSTSLEELEDAKSKATAAEQVYAAAQAAYELSVQGPRQEKVSQAKARVLVQQEIVRAIEDRLKKFTIRAPFDGYVVAENTEVGEWISQADPIAEVVELDPVEINVSVPEIHVASIQVGMMVSIRIDAAGTGTLEGVIARIVPQADIRSRTFPVRVRVANPKTASGHVLKSGMLARVTVPVGKKQQSLMVPKDALVLGGPTPSVYVVVTDPQSKQSTARPVSVQTGVAEGAWIQVSGALQAGQQVVVQGNERLLPGQAIRVAEVLSPK